MKSGQLRRFRTSDGKSINMKYVPRLNPCVRRWMPSELSLHPRTKTSGDSQMSEPRTHPTDNDQWACYERPSRSRTGEPTKIIRPVTEPQPKYFTYTGPATP